MFPLFCSIDSLEGTWSCFTVDVAWKDFYFTPCENMESSGAPSRSACGFVCLFVFVELMWQRDARSGGLRRWLIAHEVCGSHKHTRRASFYSARFRRVEVSIKFDRPHCACLRYFGKPVMRSYVIYLEDLLDNYCMKQIVPRCDDYIKCLTGYDWLNSSVWRASSCLFINFSVICQMFIHASIHPPGVSLRFQAS